MLVFVSVSLPLTGFYWFFFYRRASARRIGSARRLRFRLFPPIKQNAGPRLCSINGRMLIGSSSANHRPGVGVEWRRRWPLSIGSPGFQCRLKLTDNSNKVQQEHFWYRQRNPISIFLIGNYFDLFLSACQKQEKTKQKTKRRPAIVFGHRPDPDRIIDQSNVSYRWCFSIFRHVQPNSRAVLIQWKMNVLCLQPTKSRWSTASIGFLWNKTLVRWSCGFCSTQRTQFMDTGLKKKARTSWHCSLVPLVST